jgi:hypothetical protein
MYVSSGLFFLAALLIGWAYWLHLLNVRQDKVNRKALECKHGIHRQRPCKACAYEFEAEAKLGLEQRVDLAKRCEDVFNYTRDPVPTRPSVEAHQDRIRLIGDPMPGGVWPGLLSGPWNADIPYDYYTRRHR